MKYDFPKIKRFNYIINEMDAAYHYAAQKMGLSDSAMSILYSVCDNGGSRALSDICRSSGLSKQTISTSLHKLAADGYVMLDESRRKMKTVVLTEKGAAFTEETVIPIMRLENEIFSEWSSSELESYISLTQRFLDSFKEKTAKLPQKNISGGK